MCRNIKTLHHFDPPATEEEVRASALQYVRKLTGLKSFSRANKHACEHAVEDIGTQFRDPGIYVDDTIVWREFICPGCATRLATEVCRPDDEVLAEIRLSL